jgi:hypothetical protein
MTTKQIHRSFGILALLSALLPGCVNGKLTPEASAALNALEGPACDLAGNEVSNNSTKFTGATAVLIGAAGDVTAVLCRDTLSALIAAETGPAAAARVVVVRQSQAAPVSLAATPGCKPVAIPGDARHQVACQELHAAILAAAPPQGVRR